MRIIGGNFKGKKLFLPFDKNTRPLRDLVKESIFNLIEHSNKINIDIKNSNILDLFAGSGSFGLECLSRGAKKVVFFESYSKVIKVLEKNINSIQNLGQYEIIKSNCFDFFKSNTNFKFRFDIIFIDAPFKELRINEIIEKIIETKLLNKSGLIIVHRHKKDIIEITKKLNILESRSYGISKILFGN